MRNVADAIARSISHNEIVTIDGGDDTCSELASLCDDSVEYRGPDGMLVEYWGTDDEGDKWCVHVRRA